MFFPFKVYIVKNLKTGTIHLKAYVRAYVIKKKHCSIENSKIDFAMFFSTRQMIQFSRNHSNFENVSFSLSLPVTDLFNLNFSDNFEPQDKCNDVPQEVRKKHFKARISIILFFSRTVSIPHLYLKDESVLVEDQLTFHVKNADTSAKRTKQSALYWTPYRPLLVCHLLFIRSPWPGYMSCEMHMIQITSSQPVRPGGGGAGGRESTSLLGLYRDCTGQGLFFWSRCPI